MERSYHTIQPSKSSKGFTPTGHPEAELFHALAFWPRLRINLRRYRPGNSATNALGSVDEQNAPAVHHENHIPRPPRRIVLPAERISRLRLAYRFCDSRAVVLLLRRF